MNCPHLCVTPVVVHCISGNQMLSSAPCSLSCHVLFFLCLSCFLSGPAPSLIIPVSRNSCLFGPLPPGFSPSGSPFNLTFHIVGLLSFQHLRKLLFSQVGDLLSSRGAQLESLFRAVAEPLKDSWLQMGVLGRGGAVSEGAPGVKASGTPPSQNPFPCSSCLQLFHYQWLQILGLQSRCTESQTL